MSDPKITGLPPPDWDLPDPVETDPDRPDASFHDDHIGARLKHEEAARLKAVKDRFTQEAPRRVITEHDKIAEMGRFRPAQDDEQARKLRRQGQGKRPGTRGGRRARRETDRGGGVEPEVLRVEERVELLLADMQGMAEALDDLERAGAGAGGPDHAAELLEVQQRLQKLELQAKQQLQLLLAGGIGLTLLGDPRVTFKRLFDRIERWPKGVRPGRRPETDDEFDAFLAWIFQPPGAPVDAESAW